MKFRILWALLLFAVNTKAQFAIIKDPDGFVNVRENKSLNSKVIGKLHDKEVFLFDGETQGTEWVNVFFDSKNLTNYTSAQAARKNGYLQGFIYRNRLMPIQDLPYLKFTKGERKLTKNSYIIKNDSISLSIKTRSFNIKTHKILKTNDGCTNCTKLFVDKIDGKKPFGVDGDLPGIEISNITLLINKTTVQIPLDSFNDLYQPAIGNINIFYDKKGNIYLYMPGNSDGAGGYDVVWVINNFKLVYRYVDGIG